MEFVTKGLTVNSDSYCATYDHSSNTSTESGQKETRFFCITTTQGHIAVHKLRMPWQAWNSQWFHTLLTAKIWHRQTSGCSQIAGDIKRSTFFIGCRSWGSCVQMDLQPTRNFLHGRDEQTDITMEEMYSHKWWLCWKISVQCVREIDFFHSDITVIILYCQKLISYNWRPYLSVTPPTEQVHCICSSIWDFHIVLLTNAWSVLLSYGLCETICWFKHCE